jgi:hypothetical protein
MAQGIDLASLYVDDVIYWVALDRPQAAVLDAVEVLIPEVSTSWLVIGEISDLERSRLTMIFSAPPLVVPASEWAVLASSDIQIPLVDFVSRTGAKRYIFLGEHTLAGLVANETLEMGDSRVYYFPRYISSLTDDEKPLKMAFWNALKALV